MLAAQGQTPLGPMEALEGGAISTTIRFAVDTGQRYVAKCLRDGPPDLYEKEAAGLQALALPGCPRVPRVIAVEPTFLLLEDLGKGERKPTYWEEFGRQMAELHSHTSPTFGYAHDNYLGVMPQFNPQTDDGIAFYVETRIMRYIDAGLCKELLTPEDRRHIESYCTKLPDRVPAQRPALCHGDLWHGNVAITDGGDPAYLDPAVYYGWPEADLGMTTQYERFDDRFYDAYDEAGSSEPGWRDRLELYHIKEWLSMVAHQGEGWNALIRLRAFLDKYA